MSVSENSVTEEKPANIEVLFEKELSSSEELPRNEWSSLLIEFEENNVKKELYSEGLYTPGSGEICAKYIPMSASSVFRHPYYNYPAVTDPGIKEALFNPPPKVIYPDDGQELYIVLCEEMELVPIRIFHRALLKETVDLKYYGIHHSAFRAMAIALKLNRYVKVLDLTDNWIGVDGCFHLGEMFIDNSMINTINLTGCRIGVNGVKQLVVNLPLNRSLKELNLSKNQLGDEGMDHIITAIADGADFERLTLSHNNITATSVFKLTNKLYINNKLTYLDLSWNSIISEDAVFSLCLQLAKSSIFQVLDLSWNSLDGERVGVGIRALMKTGSIRRISLRNNRLEGVAITEIVANMRLAVKLQVLDLSSNPLTLMDTMKFIKRLWLKEVKLQQLLLENIIVPLEFVENVKKMRQQNFRKMLFVSHGEIKYPFVPTPPDMRDLIMNRLYSMCKQVKKQPPDFPILVLQWVKQFNNEITQKDIAKSLRTNGVVFHDDMNNMLVRLFPGTITEKEKSMDLVAVMDYVKRKWPDRKLPPTPPRVIEEPEILPKEKKGKGRK